MPTGHHVTHAKPGEGDAPRAEADKNRFLAWLDFNPQRAEASCASIRRRLVRFFGGWYLNSPEDLADETLIRTLQKFSGGRYLDGREAIRYILTVAKLVRREASEAQKRHTAEEVDDEIAGPDPSIEDEMDRKKKLQHLQESLARLKPAQRELILRYYRDDDARARSDFAAELGIDSNAMRVRANYIRRLLLDLLRRRRVTGSL